MLRAKDILKWIKRERAYDRISAGIKPVWRNEVPVEAGIYRVYRRPGKHWHWETGFDCAQVIEASRVGPIDWPVQVEFLGDNKIYSADELNGDGVTYFGSRIEFDVFDPEEV